jgi:UDP-N-acetylglucosamine acyltransferase
VGPFAVIERGAQIAANCRIGAHAVIHGCVRIDATCQIHAGAVLGDEPQDTAFKEGKSAVHVGPECIIREGVTIHRGTEEGSITRIGRGCMLMAFSHVAHNAELDERVVLCNGALVAGYVKIGPQAFISGHCLLHQFVRVGRLAMLGGGAGASRDVPPFVTLRPLEPNRILGLNVVGLRRSGIGPEDRLAIKRALHAIRHSDLPQKDAARWVENHTDNPFARELATFVATSKRGICSFRGAPAHDAAGPL